MAAYTAAPWATRWVPRWNFYRYAILARNMARMVLPTWRRRTDGVGAITDDTQMTLFTAEGLLRAGSRMSDRGIVHAPSMVHHAYLRWMRTQGASAPELRCFKQRPRMAHWRYRAARSARTRK